MDKFNLYENLSNGFESLLSVYEVQMTPIIHYLRNYERICKFIQRDLVSAIVKTDESYLKFVFFDIMSKKGSALVKQTFNQIEKYF